MKSKSPSISSRDLLFQFGDDYIYMMEIHIFIYHIDVEDGNIMDIIIIYYNPFPLLSLPK